MIKHADSLNFWQALKNHQTQRRNKELRPAWWANAALPEAGTVPAAMIGHHAFKPDQRYYTQNTDELRDIVDRSGMDLATEHQPAPFGTPEFIEKLLRNYGYKHKGVSELASQVPARDGSILKMMGDPDRWHIPALAHEIGHAQEEHTMGGIAKAIQHARPVGTLGVLGSDIESFRALSNADRPIGERKQMLNRASLFAGAGTAPILVNEFRASRNGLRFLKSLPLANKAEILQEAGRAYPRMFSTYALMAAAPVLAPQIAKLFLPKHVD